MVPRYALCMKKFARKIEPSNTYSLVSTPEYLVFHVYVYTTNPTMSTTFEASMNFYNYVKMCCSRLIEDEMRLDAHMKISDLANCDLIHNTKTASFQRSIDHDNVNKIVKCQQENFQKYGTVLYPSPILIGFVQTTPAKECKIIDGQHRYSSICRLATYPEYKNQTVPVTILKVNSHHDLGSLFKQVNSNLPVPEYLFSDISTTQKRILEETETHFFTKYPNIFVSEARKRVVRPKIRKCDFQEMLSIIYTKVHKQTNDLISAIEKENARASTYNWERQLSNLKSPGHMIARATHEGFWLGLSNANHEFKSDWVERCINHIQTRAKSKMVRKLRKKTTQTPKTRTDDATYTHPEMQMPTTDTTDTVEI